MAKQRMTREEAILDILENAPGIGRRQAEAMVDKNIGDDPNYYKGGGKPKEQEVMDSSYEIEEFHPGPDRMGDIKNLVDSLGKAINLGLGSDSDKDKPEDAEELLKEIEEGSESDASKFDFKNWWDEEPEEETKEERLERQIDYYRDMRNEMRDHVFDSDMGYMQQQDSESIIRQDENQQLTQIVEGLQRQAAYQGDRQNLASIPFGGEYGKGAVPHNTSEFFNRPNPMADAAEGLGQGQPQDPAQLQAIAQQQALRRIQMQTERAGGGQLPGYLRGYDPWQGNPQSRYQ
tara:strand:- start:1091 stop:1960 length:870 start_codon:yes stop_codon:yes gene_type:complete